MFGVVQQILLPEQLGGTLNVVPPGKSLGMSAGPFADTYWNSDSVARSWMALSRRLAIGNPPLIGCTHEQPLPAHAASESITSAVTALRSRDPSLCIWPSGPQITSSGE